MSKYVYRTSARAVTDAVLAVARSPDSRYEFVVGPELDAANEAALLGMLQTSGDGSFGLGVSGPSVATAKDPEGYVMTYADISAMAKARGDDDFLDVRFRNLHVGPAA